MAEPLSINCDGQCTVTVLHEISLPVLNLSLEDGGQIGLSIIAVWVVGWSIRMVIRLITDGSHFSEKDID